LCTYVREQSGAVAVITLIVWWNVKAVAFSVQGDATIMAHIPELLDILHKDIRAEMEAVKPKDNINGS